MKKILYKNIFIFLLFLVFLVCYFINLNYNYKRNSNLKIIKYNGYNLMINIDGVNSNFLPSTQIYYLSSYDCDSINTKIVWDKVGFKLNISNGEKKANISCNLNFKSKPLLSEMNAGDYVKYVGDNGCEGNLCEGYNANYVDETDMGFCEGYSYAKFYVNGWRIAYIDDNTAYLISAGAPECMCTSADGISSNSNCDGKIVNSNDMYKHNDNLNASALKYCNINFVYNGFCSLENVNSFNSFHFSKILDKNTNCLFNDISCGLNNSLLDNGSFYWVNDNFNIQTYYWNPRYKYFNKVYTNSVNGVRPVIRLDSSVIITGGDGTYENPYLIDNNYFIIGDGTGVFNSNDDLSNVSLSLNSVVDASKMCISVDTSSCSNFIDYNDTYFLNLSSVGTGEKIIYVYYKDAYNKIVSTMQRKVVINSAG